MTRVLEVFTVILVSAFFSSIATNCSADQATLRDCATKGEARMAGGGTIECTVRKETK